MNERFDGCEPGSSGAERFDDANAAAMPHDPAPSEAGRMRVVWDARSERTAAAASSRPSVRESAGRAPRKRTAPKKRDASSGARKGRLAPGSLWTPTKPPDASDPRPRGVTARGGSPSLRVARPRRNGKAHGVKSALASALESVAGLRGAPFVLAGIAAVIVVAVFIGAIVIGHGSDQTADSGASDAVPALPAKLSGSAETVDANGIVHGTTPEGVSYTLRGRGAAGAAADRVTLAAVGDQIATDNSLPIADAYEGASGDGEYSFVPFYQEVEPFLAQYDLRYINQETVMAGTDGGYAYSGYPMFNTPDAAADAIAEVGFNLVNFATNHIYDMGNAGIERSHEVWDRFPELTVAGSYPTPEERDTVQLVERNGMTFAFLAYTYGDNSYVDPANMPNDYYLRVFDKDAISADVERAQQVADAVIVSMHWGTEYESEPNDQQLDYAQFLVDLGVDAVIGTHAHTMQPVHLYEGPDGSMVPVVFGLSDFISGWTLTDTILSGVFTCDFVRADDGGVEAENPVWHPTIEWSDGADVYVRFLKDMDEAETNANTRTEDVADDYTYLRDKIDSVGMEIPVDL